MLLPSIFQGSNHFSNSYCNNSPHTSSPAITCKDHPRRLSPHSFCPRHDIITLMPAKNAIKEYHPGGYYHIYNRGVDKRTIFENDKDYKTFLSFLRLYLTPPNLRGPSSQDQFPTAPTKQLNNFAGEITLLAYCLMPNHFHLFVKQESEHGINHFMRSLATKYVRYFNSQHNRIGPLFQGIYKAVHIENEYQYVYLTKYIHRNPHDLPAYKTGSQPLSSYPYSSYPNYLNQFSQSWINTDEILSRFSSTNHSLSYQSFVEDSEPDDIKIISQVALDLD